MYCENHATKTQRVAKQYLNVTVKEVGYRTSDEGTEGKQKYSFTKSQLRC